MSIAVVRRLLLGALAWLLWDRLGLMGVAAVPVALLFLLFWNQESMLYVPRKGQYSQRPADVKPLDNYEELTLVGLDGTKITAWFIKQHDRASEKHSRSYRTCPTIIFLHGNGGTMSDRLVNIRGLFACTGCNVLMVEYRGYGTSNGEPSEDGLKLDAQAALDYLHEERKDVDSRQIFVFGRSLGGAVAIWLAHRNPRGLRGVMVENSFTSIYAMATPIFPFLELIPRALLDLLLMSRWDSLALVGDLDMPVLFLAGEDDEVVPHEQMLQLYHEHRDHAARGGGSSSSDSLFGKKGQGSGDSHVASETSAASSGGVCAAGAGSGQRQRQQQQQSTLVSFPGGRHNETWMLDDYYSHIESWLDSFPAPQHPPAS